MFVVLGRVRSDPQVMPTYHFIGNVGQLIGTYTGDSLSIRGLQISHYFLLAVAVWPFDNSFDFSYLLYTNVLKI